MPRGTPDGHATADVHVTDFKQFADAGTGYRTVGETLGDAAGEMAKATEVTPTPYYEKDKMIKALNEAHEAVATVMLQAQGGLNAYSGAIVEIGQDHQQTHQIAVETLGSIINNHGRAAAVQSGGQ